MSAKNKAFENRNLILADRIIKNLNSRNFEAFYCKDSFSAVDKAISLIPKDSLVSWGGSITLQETGLIERIYQEKFDVIDRDKAETKEERFNLMRKSLLCDVYLTSFNAISEDGILVNVDGIGNRVAAISFGPKNIIAMVGMNKVCKTAEDAVIRARTYAAPLNAHRDTGSPFLTSPKNTPCAVSGFCGDCKTGDCICSYIVETRMCKIPKRIKVILVGESLGF